MSEIKLKIDGIEIAAEQGQTVLRAALAAGVFIPHLCTHPDLESQGGCKLCVAYINGDKQPVCSCKTPAEDGMEVVTKDDHLLHIRRTAMELMLASHPSDCSTCKQYLHCEMQSMIQYLGAANARMRHIDRPSDQINVNNPIIVRELQRCIRCGRCIRACRELRGVEVIDYCKLGDESYVGTANDLPFVEADCRFCSACVEVCPTGALQDAAGVFPKDRGLPRELTYVPCSAECPAHTDIPTYVRLVKEGRYAESAAVIRQKLTFPHALSYVCNNKCETACKRGCLNEPINIRNLKRFAVEHDDQQLWRGKDKGRQDPPTGKKVAVIGAGATGLTAAYYLAKKGHSVKVFERHPVSGGMMALGIPSYRLPREELQDEVNAIKEVGVEIENNAEIKNVQELKAQGYDAVLVAVGAAAGKKLQLPGTEYGHNLSAVDFLRAVALGQPTPDVQPGTKVVVLGGGNVAFDAARVSRRLGAEVRVTCLEAEKDMLAGMEEIEGARAEGIEVYPGNANICIEGSEAGLTGMRIIKVKEFRFEEGKLIVETIPGTEQVLPCDTIIFAAGQKTDLTEAFGLELNRFGYPTYDKETNMASEGIFVAGDVITGTKFVISAVAGGREVAEKMDKYLGGDGDIEEKFVEIEEPDANIGKAQGFGKLGRKEIRDIPPEERAEAFSPINEGFCEMDARLEGGRCLQCDLRKQIAPVKLWPAFKVK